VDMGPGIKYSSNTLGSAGNRYITSGNVYAPNKASVVTNTPANGDSTVVMTKVTLNDESGMPIPNKTFDFMAKSTVGSYQYTATTDANGDAYVWILPGTQLVICKDIETDEIIETSVIDLRTLLNTPTTIDIPEIDDYTAVSKVPEEATWLGGITPLDPIVYDYLKKRPLVLKAYNLDKSEYILGGEHSTVVQPVGEDCDYGDDIEALTALLELLYPGEFVLEPIIDLTVFRIERDPLTNVVTIYYREYIEVPRTLAISKTVEGMYGNLTLPFAFGVTFENGDGSPYTVPIDYEITDNTGAVVSSGQLDPADDGVFFFELIHNQQIKFEGFEDDDVEYAIMEAVQSEYEVSVDGLLTGLASGTIDATNITTVREYLNTKEDIVHTAVKDNALLPILALLSMGVILSGIYCLMKYQAARMHSGTWARRHK